MPTSRHEEGPISVLVIDVGTSSVRASIVRPDGEVGHVHRLPLPPAIPAPGLVEFDPSAMAAAALEVAAAALAAGGPVEGVGVTAQRSSTVVWDAVTGTPLGPGLGWQDLRTAGMCLELQGEGFRFSPSETATKAAWLLDTYDADRTANPRVGTVDSWITWQLTGGHSHVTDLSNAAVTGLLSAEDRSWRQDLLDRLRIPTGAMPAIVDSSGLVGPAVALEGGPVICGIAGDQQASLMGQGCTRPGMAKATFGTGAMLDVCTGKQRPGFSTRGEGGCFPIVAWSRGGEVTWGVEAIALAAGSTVDWLVEDLGLLGSAGESEEVASSCADTGGVVMVPALLGFGTPQWDFGARGTVLGLTRGSGRAELVRAVLEGVANQGADLLEAAEADAGAPVAALRVDGGMTANGVFVQALADACGRPVEVSPQLEATTLGAGYLAGLAVGMWNDEEDVAAKWRPRVVVDPRDHSNHAADRARWRLAVKSAGGWYPELSAVQF
ncbi:MAG: FGGY family carbohydrate kinase [Acidimicrobiales bacterium]